MEKHAKTWKHNGCIVDNYDVLMCNVIYLILYEWRKNNIYTVVTPNNNDRYND